MKKIHPILAGLIHATGTALYVAGIAFFIAHAPMFFPKRPSVLSLASLLMLLVLSGTVTGLLVLGKPAILFGEGAKKQAIILLLATIAWLFVFTVAALGILSIMR